MFFCARGKKIESVENFPIVLQRERSKSWVVLFDVVCACCYEQLHYIVNLCKFATIYHRRGKLCCAREFFSSRNFFCLFSIPTKNTHTRWDSSKSYANCYLVAKRSESHSDKDLWVVIFHHRHRHHQRSAVALVVKAAALAFLSNNDDEKF